MLLQPFLGGCTLQRGTFIIDVLQADYSQQQKHMMFVEKKLYKKATELEKHIKHTMRLLRSVGNKCEGSELQLGHAVVVVPSGVETGPALWTHGNRSDDALDIMAESDDGEVVEDENDVKEEILMKHETFGTVLFG